MNIAYLTIESFVEPSACDPALVPVDMDWYATASSKWVMATIQKSVLSRAVGVELSHKFKFTDITCTFIPIACICMRDRDWL